MTDNPPASIHIGGDAEHSILVIGSQNIIIQAAAQATREQRDPTRMLRVAAILAAPVHDPTRPDRPPAPLDLRSEWRRLEQAVCGAHAPILLARLVPPTLDTLRRELSPRVAEQANPQAFRPDLARSLGAHGTVLRGLERHAEAVDAFGEGIQALTPLFRRLPQAFAGLMEALVSGYFNACQAAGREPDSALLGPVAAALEDL
ncbi:MAG: hypothetical protein NUW24_06635 [Anaerolineae bacterium]|jgi:hypothetical protein|nr:hypothetical protein [Anaerolineae bacterium]MDH7472792.1 hypothetical protein [Anaerolineae bacterium]